MSFKGVEDASEQDKKPECDGPRGTSSKVMIILAVLMFLVVMTIMVMGMNVNVMDQGNGRRNTVYNGI